MRKHIVLLFLLVIGSISFAQKVANSPYSSFGLGETEGLDHGIFSGIGNNQITFCDSSILNYFNPASYNMIGKGQPLFSLGVSSRLSNYSQGDYSEFSSVTSLTHFSLGLSFANHFGLAFGLKPYSRRGYEFNTGTSVGTDSIVYNYSGSGSINEAFIGFSTDLLKFDSTRLAIGGNAGWLFGNVSNTRKSYIHGTAANVGGVGIKELDVRSFHYELGAYFTHQINDNHGFGLYATMEPAQNIRATYNSGLFYATSSVNDPNFFDTLSYSSLTDSTLTIAPKYTYGLSYTWKLSDTKEKQRELHPAISVYASYSMTDWSKYQNRFDADTTTFLNTSKLNFGVQFIPESEFQLNTATTSFFARLRYRAGFYSYTLPYAINDEQITDFGTTFGIGIPVSVQKSLSSINIGFAYGKRGVSDQLQLNEKYYGINVGIIIAPSEAEKWFRKRKLN